MRLEHYSAQTLKKQLLTICDQYLRKVPYTLFFFGSRVSGKGDEHSDIDVGIEAAKKIPLEILSKIKEDVEGLPILYKIEIVDFKSVSPEFRRVASTSLEIIHE